jgi:hypothetical protein
MTDPPPNSNPVFSVLGDELDHNAARGSREGQFEHRAGASGAGCFDMTVRDVASRLRIAARITGLALLLGTVLGCASGVERFGVPIPAKRVAQIEMGRTTRAEVLSLLGPPTFGSGFSSLPDEKPPKLVLDPGEKILLWEYQERRERFATVILYTFFSQWTLTDMIDARDVVSHVALGHETGSGD